jgi:hypothetical protein
MDGSPSSTHPTSGAASSTAFHIRRHGDPIPVTVHITWTDGMEGEVNGWTSQWTRTHVCVVRESAPPYHPFWVRASDVRRRAARTPRQSGWLRLRAQST